MIIRVNAVISSRIPGKNARLVMTSSVCTSSEYVCPPFVAAACISVSPSGCAAWAGSGEQG